MIWLKLINKYQFNVFLRLLTTDGKFRCFSFASKAEIGEIIVMSPVVLYGIYRTLISCYTSRGKLYQRTTLKYHPESSRAQLFQDTSRQMIVIVTQFWCY